MTPSGVHMNKTAIAVIIGLLVLIVLGFKYKGGADKIVSFDEKENKGIDLNREREEIKRKEEEKLKREEEFKKDEKLKKQKEEELKKKQEEELKKKQEEESKKKEEDLKKKEGEELKKKEEESKKKEEDLKKKEGEEIKKKEEYSKNKNKTRSELKKEEQNQGVINRPGTKTSNKTESMAATIPDWKSVNWMETKIPDEIISLTAKMIVEKKTYNVTVRHFTF